MEALFLKIVNISITASYLLLALIVLRPCLKKLPRWLQTGLWLLPALRLMLPRSLESILSLVPTTQTLPDNIVYTARPYIHSGFNSLDDLVNPVLSESLAPAPAASANPTQLLSFVFSRLWLIGMAAMLLYALISWAVLRRRMASAVRLRENIYESDRTASPFVLGLFRPRVYLPFGLPEEDKPHVIAHEYAHIHRKDHWWKPLGFALLSVYWFNPLVWLGYLLFCRDIEAACDEKVIAKLSQSERREYSRALLNCAAGHRTIAACPLAFGEVGVKQRIKSVMHYKKPALWLLIAGILIAAAGAVFFLTDPPETDVKNPWVQEYIPGEENILGNVDTASFEAVSRDFAIGADRYGRAVFKDPHKAFETFLKICAPGIEIIQQEMGLDPISASDYELYKKYGWQVTYGTIRQRELARFVTKFLDIYENSFLEAPPDTWMEVTAAPEAKTLSLNDVIILSGKGNALRLSDLEDFSCRDHTHLGVGQDPGQDNIVRIYEINRVFRLEVSISDGYAENFFLVHIPTTRYIDIREGNVAAFIGGNKRELRCVDISYRKGFTCLDLPREYEEICVLLEEGWNTATPVTDPAVISETIADPYGFYNLNFNKTEETITVRIALDGRYLLLEEDRLYLLADPERVAKTLEAVMDSLRNETVSGIPFATADTPWDWAKGVSIGALTDGKIGAVHSIEREGLTTTKTVVSGTLATRRLPELIALLNSLERKDFVPGKKLEKMSGSELISGGKEGSVCVLLFDGVNSLAAVLRYSDGKAEMLLTEETEKFREDHTYLTKLDIWEIRDEALCSYMAELYSYPPAVIHTVGSEYAWYGPVIKRWENGTLFLYLIDGWIYEEINEDAHSGIRFRPAGEKEGWIYFGYWPGGYHAEEGQRHYSESTYNGNVWWTSYTPQTGKAEERIWSYSQLHTDHGDYAILNEGTDEWFLEYEDQIQDIISWSRSAMDTKISE